MESEAIKVKQEDHIATVTFNRPEKLNAVNIYIVDELNEHLDRLAADDDVRVVILTGSGRGFCSGGDMGTPGVLQHETYDDLEGWRRSSVRRYGGVTRRLFYMEKPTIAMVNGIAYGAGFSFALACDMRIGSENARFNLGFTRVGVQPEGGADWLLAHIVGLGKAAELLFACDFVNAEDAVRMNLLNRLVPADKLEEETMALATKIANNPPIAIRIGKMLLHRTVTMDLASALEMGHAGGTALQATYDHHESIAAFRERRQPIFEGR